MIFIITAVFTIGGSHLLYFRTPEVVLHVPITKHNVTTMKH